MMESENMGEKRARRNNEHPLSWYFISQALVWVVFSHLLTRPFHPHQLETAIALFYGWRNYGIERLNNLPKTHQISAKEGIRTLF